MERHDLLRRIQNFMIRARSNVTIADVRCSRFYKIW